MKQIAMLLYPGFTPLDAIGPYHALSQFPGYEFSYVALEAGPISDGTSTTLIAQKSISELSKVDIAEILLSEGKIAVAPGHLYGASGSGFIRINFATSREIIDDAVTRIATVLNSL